MPQLLNVTNYLKTQNNAADWQIRQAHDAIRLYFNHFIDSDSSDITSHKKQIKQDSADISKIIYEMRQAIRIRHYSHRTEQSYIAWVKRFLIYIMGDKLQKSGMFGPDSADVKNYLNGG